MPSGTRRSRRPSNIPTNPDVISFDEARKLGLDPGKAIAHQTDGSFKRLNRFA